MKSFSISLWPLSFWRNCKGSVWRKKSTFEVSRLHSGAFWGIVFTYFPTSSGCPIALRTPSSKSDPPDPSVDAPTGVGSAASSASGVWGKAPAANDFVHSEGLKWAHMLYVILGVVKQASKQTSKQSYFWHMKLLESDIQCNGPLKLDDIKSFVSKQYVGPYNKFTSPGCDSTCSADLFLLQLQTFNVWWICYSATL